MGEPITSRPLISLSQGKICHNGKPCKIVMRRGKISIACSDITPEALDWLIDKYLQNFDEGKSAVVVQEGEQ